MGGGAVDLGPCPLCGRPMIDGASVDRHHLVPKCEGGRATVWLHRICHRKIHSVLDERSLARDYPTAEALLRHPDIAAFVAWVRRRPVEFSKRTAPSRQRRGRRVAGGRRR
ncbi:MAG: HNH endonuclease [Pseudomonadota bacterium]